jgi:LmbE family N-acetylglucosaminyl deacetylase
VTVITGGRLAGGALSPWDQMCGFKPGDDPWAARKAEDAEAMALVGADPHHLGFPDVQYRVRPVRFGRFRPGAVRAADAARERADSELVPEIEKALESQIAALDVETWFIPLGLGHPDHRMVGAICARLAARMDDRAWVAYVDLPYGPRSPVLISNANENLAALGFSIEPLDIALSQGSSRKRELIACYRSQLGPLGDQVEGAIAARETFSRLSMRPGR